MFSPIAIDGSEDMMTREELLVLQQGQNFLRTSGSANVNYMETLITLGKLAAQCTTGTGTASGGFKINWEKLMKVAMLDVGTAPEAADALYRKKLELYKKAYTGLFQKGLLFLFVTLYL